MWNLGSVYLAFLKNKKYSGALALEYFVVQNGAFSPSATGAGATGAAVGAAVGALTGATGAGAVFEHPARGGSDLGEVKTAQEQQGSRKPGGKLDPGM